MSLGGLSTNLKGDVRKSNTGVGVIDPPRIYGSKDMDIDTTTILTLPSFGSCIYTTVQSVLILSIVGALWTMASGLWWIKYYVECNQGVIQC